MVDISYLGFDRANLHKLDDAGERRALRRASRLPFDGMNERGLAVAMAAVHGRTLPGRRAARGSLGVMRLMLDRARRCSEAVAIFRRRGRLQGGPPLPYLVADASGDSA